MALSVACTWFTAKSGESTFQFPNIDGWKRSRNIQIFSPQNLFNYINGASEFYLAYDFQELQVAEYHSGKDASILVEVYRHRTPLHAFGIYSQERPREGEFLDIGAQGYCQVPMLNFVTGDYYVKINGYGNETRVPTLLKSLARALANNLNGRTSLPDILTCFPPKGKLPNSESFVARDFMGYEFLPAAFTAEYDLLGATFRIFIISAEDSAECREVLGEYRAFAGYRVEGLRQGRHTIDDPYHGAVTLQWKGNFIWGVLELADEDLSAELLALTEARISKYRQLQPEQ